MPTSKTTENDKEEEMCVRNARNSKSVYSHLKFRLVGANHLGKELLRQAVYGTQIQGEGLHRS